MDGVLWVCAQSHVCTASCIKLSPENIPGHINPTYTTHSPLQVRIVHVSNLFKETDLWKKRVSVTLTLLESCILATAPRPHRHFHSVWRRHDGNSCPNLILGDSQQTQLSITDQPAACDDAFPWKPTRPEVSHIEKEKPYCTHHLNCSTSRDCAVAYGSCSRSRYLCAILRLTRWLLIRGRPNGCGYSLQLLINTCVEFNSTQ